MKKDNQKSSNHRGSIKIVFYLMAIKVFMTLLFLYSNPSYGSIYTSEIPSGFYDVAASEGVPVKVLWSIALNESEVKTNYGRVIAWQFTLNHKGKGYFFNTAPELKAKILELLNSGETLFDVGIAQVNYHWHKEAFNSIDDMIDPYKNLTYAAQYLKQHFKKTNSWWEAVGLYHSPRNGVNARNYRKKVMKIWQQL
jgi:Transglycosylase SLT domain